MSTQVSSWLDGSPPTILVHATCMCNPRTLTKALKLPLFHGHEFSAQTNSKHIQLQKISRGLCFFQFLTINPWRQSKGAALFFRQIAPEMSLSFCGPKALVNMSANIWLTHSTLASPAAIFSRTCWKWIC
jgi:hypothetical protein